MRKGVVGFLPGWLVNKAQLVEHVPVCTGREVPSDRSDRYFFVLVPFIEVDVNQCVMRLLFLTY